MPLSDHEQPTRPTSILTPETRTVRSPRPQWPMIALAMLAFVTVVGGIWLATRPAANDPPADTTAPLPTVTTPGEVNADAEYTVVAGDTMKRIAEKVYGDPEGWPPIYEANRATIGPNPDSLTVGSRLRIPPR